MVVGGVWMACTTFLLVPLLFYLVLVLLYLVAICLKASQLLMLVMRSTYIIYHKQRRLLQMPANMLNTSALLAL